MTKYHINSNTGNPGLCKATKSCPFGDLTKDHYETKQAAQQAFEKQMNTALPKSLKQHNNIPGLKATTPLEKTLKTAFYKAALEDDPESALKEANSQQYYITKEENDEYDKLSPKLKESYIAYRAESSDDHTETMIRVYQDELSSKELENIYRMDTVVRNYYWKARIKGAPHKDTLNGVQAYDIHSSKENWTQEQNKTFNKLLEQNNYNYTKALKKMK